MRSTSCLLLLVATLAVSLVASPVRAADPVSGDRLQYPLAPSTIALRKGNLTFQAHWTGPPGSMFNPQVVTSALAFSGAGTDGTVGLDPGKWKILPKGRGYQYVDRRGSAGGVPPGVQGGVAAGGGVRLGLLFRAG